MKAKHQRIQSEVSRRHFAQILTLGGSALWIGGTAFGKPDGMRRIETRGGPFLRGKQQGEATRELFHPWVKTLFEERAKRYGISPSEFERKAWLQAKRWRDHTAAVYPEAIEECRGIITGLGVDESTFYIALYSPDISQLVPQCTVIGFRDSQGRPLVAKTDDVGKYELGMNILEITRPDRGYRHLHFHFAGTIWTVAGMNEKGLSMGMNGIPAADVDRPGMSSLAALHTILPNCATVEDAIEHIRSLRVSCGGFSLLLGDPTGVLSLVEKTSAGTAVLGEEKGKALVHANEIVDPQFARKNPAQTEPLRTNSSRRYQNAMKQVLAGKSMDQLMNDRSSSGALCQRGENGMYTDFAAVFAPVELQFKFWSGYPNKVVTETIELKSVLATG